MNNEGCEVSRRNDPAVRMAINNKGCTPEQQRLHVEELAYRIYIASLAFDLYLDAPNPHPFGIFYGDADECLRRLPVSPARACQPLAPSVLRPLALKRLICSDVQNLLLVRRLL